MEKQTVKEQLIQRRKYYLMNRTPVPGYLKEENHTCDLDSYQYDPESCPACKEQYENQLKQENLGKYR